MPVEIEKNVLTIDGEVGLNLKLFPDGNIVLEVNRGLYTHIIRVTPNGKTCEVSNTVRNKSAIRK